MQAIAGQGGMTGMNGVRMTNMSELFPRNYLINGAHEIISTNKKGLDVSPFFDIQVNPLSNKFEGRFSLRGFYPTTMRFGGIIKSIF